MGGRERDRRAGERGERQSRKTEREPCTLSLGDRGGTQGGCPGTLTGATPLPLVWTGPAPLCFQLVRIKSYLQEVLGGADFSLLFILDPYPVEKNAFEGIRLAPGPVLFGEQLEMMSSIKCKFYLAAPSGGRTGCVSHMWAHVRVES